MIFILLAVNQSGVKSQEINKTKFNKQYEQTGQYLKQAGDSLTKLLTIFRTDTTLSEIEKARLDLLLSKSQILNEIYPIPRPALNIFTDTTGKIDQLLKEAQNMIVQSRPDEGVPLIMQYLEKVNNNTDSAVFAKIYLAEAYRQKQEYNKGIGLLTQILAHKNISTKNRAFAMNRLAALYNESTMINAGKSDSVVKYSQLCMDISKRYGFTEYLAASQNELGNNYWQHNMLDSALLLINEASENFLRIKKYPQAINTYINLSRVYTALGREQQSIDILHKAIQLGDVRENRNLFMYIYADLSYKYYLLGDCQSAYDYNVVAGNLFNQFFHDRIQMQINEMSAKYDLQAKEEK
ncbi:MAG: tetratricopeptide repeat protein, partial [Bacteroidales bacterium]|nr:tetratricopeptide repeat protein [Bacteroidales bacterium]